MTKVRPPDSFADAAMAAISTLGRERAAQVVERADHHVYRWADPSPGGDRPNVEQALRLDIAMLRAGHQPPFLAAWRAQLGRIDAPHQPPADLRELMLSATREAGETAAAVQRATADGHVDAADRADIIKQAKERRAAFDAIIRAAGGTGPLGLVTVDGSP